MNHNICCLNLKWKHKSTIKHHITYPWTPFVVLLVIVADRKRRLQCSVRIVQSCTWAVILGCSGRWRSLTVLDAWNRSSCLAMVDGWKLSHLSMAARLIQTLYMTNASERKSSVVSLIFSYVSLSFVVFYLFIDNFRFIGQKVSFHAYTPVPRAQFW